MTGRHADLTPYGERGWLATLSHMEDPIASGLAANDIAERLRSAVGVDDVVAGVNSIVLRFDPSRINPDTARMMLEKEIRDARTPAPAAAAHPFDIPVLYGGQAGPDLADLAKHAGLSEETIIAAHRSKVYHVASVGFAPGFAYLGMLDDRLQTPRLASPRAHVPAGSVGVAGGFTCIYPMASPGGWRLIGRTPMRLFDLTSEDPFRLKPGAAVQFRAIGEEEFKDLETS